jgi:hypothetical protein
MIGGPGEDTPVTIRARFTVYLGSATAVGGALARGYGSDLLPLRLPSDHSPAVRFAVSPGFREEREPLLGARSLPVAKARFDTPLGVFGGADESFISPLASADGLVRSSSRATLR